MKLKRFSFASCVSFAIGQLVVAQCAWAVTIKFTWPTLPFGQMLISSLVLAVFSVALVSATAVEALSDTLANEGARNISTRQSLLAGILLQGAFIAAVSILLSLCWLLAIPGWATLIVAIVLGFFSTHFLSRWMLR